MILDALWKVTIPEKDQSKMINNLLNAAGLDSDCTVATLIEWIRQAKILMDEQHRMIAMLHPEITFGTPENPKKMGDLKPEAVNALRRNVYSGDIGLDDVADQLVDERKITLDKAWELLQATYQLGEFTEEGLRYKLSDGTTITRPFEREQNAN